jgi:DNA-directed RNA polymerases I, II, and III subunit RPABC3
MAATGDAQLFEESFVITEYDQHKYDRVARITAMSSDNQTQMTLDINIELFPCQRGETLHVMLATTLSLDGKVDSEERGWRDVKTSAESSLADMYDYVCHGKIYKFEDGADGHSM